jgi:hypothetical protein
MTLTLLTVTPGLLTFTVAPETKLEPVRVTFTLVPAVPLLGLIEVSVGADGVGGLRVKLTGLLVPPDVFTVTLAEPEAAVAAMRKVAVIWLAFATLTLLTVTPGLLTFTVAPETKLEPVRVTFKLVPAVPLSGLMEVSVGEAGTGTDVV